MKITLWNFRGINQAPTKQVLKDIIVKHQPSIAFSSETKPHEKDDCCRLSVYVGWDHYAANLRVGQFGDLLLRWRDCINIWWLENNKDLAEGNNLPWVVGGKVNEVINDSEKEGDGRRPAWQNGGNRSQRFLAAALVVPCQRWRQTQ